MPDIKILKTIVLAMTAILVIMFVLVVYGLSRTPDAALSSATAAAFTPVKEDSPRPAWLYALPDGVHIRQASLSDKGELAVIIDSPGGQEVLLINSADGALKGRVITAAPAKTLP